MKVVIEVIKGVVQAVHSTNPDIEVHIVDYDTNGMDKESLMEYASEVLIPRGPDSGDCHEILTDASKALTREAEEL